MNETTTIEDGDALANAAFALHFAFINIEIDAEATFQVTENHFYDLLYDLTFREIGADGLILHFQTISNLVAEGNLSLILD